MKAQLLLAAAGHGRRLGGVTPKALIPLGGEPLFIRALRAFSEPLLSSGTVIVFAPGFEARFQAAQAEFLPDLRARYVEGGEERQDSVRRGLDALEHNTEIVVIHDAARPFPPGRATDEAIQHAGRCGAATVAIPCTDTILESDAEAVLRAIPDRSRLWACQTPQVFRVDVIRAAHEAAATDGRFATDDSRLVLENGGAVKIVSGAATNLKVTSPEDLAYAEFLLETGEV